MVTAGKHTSVQRLRLVSWVGVWGLLQEAVPHTGGRMHIWWKQKGRAIPYMGVSLRYHFGGPYNKDYTS